jgi:phage tail sheath protein FI
MSANFLHGVETIEVERGARPIRGVKTAVIGLVGTAPIYERPSADQKINEPVLVLSDRDAAKYFGSSASGYTIPQALDAIFDQGSGIVIAINVFDPATHRTDLAAQPHTFGADDKATLAHPGVGGVVVKNVGGATTYVLNDDYTVNLITGVITRVGTGLIAAGGSIEVDYSYADPAKVIAADIIGEVDALTGDRTGMQAWKDAYNLFGFFPKILIAPAYCTQDSVVAETIVLAGALRAIALIDAPIGTTFAQALAGRGPEGAINFNYSSDRLVPCFPHLKRYDAATDAEVLEPFSQRLAGVIAAKDNERGYWWSPSNTEIKGITGVEAKLTAMINDPACEVNLLNEAGILTVFNSYGTGIRTWGNRSAAWPSLTHPKNFINIRRTADVLHESVEYSMLQFIDFPINDALIDAITESVDAFIRTLIGRGAVLDGKCTYDPAKNPPTEIALGHLLFDVAFMPPTPAERITFESFIDIELLKNLGTGGNA